MCDATFGLRVHVNGTDAPQQSLLGWNGRVTPIPKYGGTSRRGAPSTPVRPLSVQWPVAREPMRPVGSCPLPEVDDAPDLPDGAGGLPALDPAGREAETRPDPDRVAREIGRA